MYNKPLEYCSVFMVAYFILDRIVRLNIFIGTWFLWLSQYKRGSEIGKIIVHSTVFSSVLCLVDEITCSNTGYHGVTAEW